MCFVGRCLILKFTVSVFIVEKSSQLNKVYFILVHCKAKTCGFKRHGRSIDQMKIHNSGINNNLCLRSPLENLFFKSAKTKKHCLLRVEKR